MIQRLAAKKAGKIKTNLKVKSRKEEVETENEGTRCKSKF
jgi:hypothetical protein